MRVTSYSRRVIGPFLTLGQDVVHDSTHELCWVTRGSLAGQLGDKSFVIDARFLSVIPAGVAHSSWTLDEEVEERVLHVRAIAIELPPRAFLVPATGELRALLDAFPEDATRLDVLATATDRLLERLPSFEEAAGGELDPRLQRVMVAIAGEPTAAYSLDDLARIACLSPYHFSRAFKDQTGETPMRYLRRHRVGLAARLLRTTRYSVAQIASRTGFSSAGRLSEAFSQVMGESPSAHRAAARA